MRLQIVFLLLSAVAVSAADQPDNTWTKISPRPDAPVPRFGWEGCGVFDTTKNLWIHQGGHDGIPQGFALFTCELATGAWQQQFPNNSPAGVCCIDGSAAFDSANHKLVRFPGGSLGHGYQYSRGVRLKDSVVWLYDLESNTWTNMRPPPYKSAGKYSKEKPGGLNASATYDPNHEVAITMGGQSAGGSTNSLFVYDAYSNSFEMLRAKNPPSPRDGHGICYDAKNDALVVFGSQYAQDEKTWVYRYSTNAWEALDLNPHPPGLKNKQYSTIPKMAFDSRNNICLCITWNDNTGEHQTWALDFAAKTWTQMNPAKEPDTSSSRSRNLTFVPSENLFVFELCAPEKSGRGPELWTYRYKKAEPLLPAPTGLSALVTGSNPPAKDNFCILTWQAPAGVEVKNYVIHRAEVNNALQTKYEPLATTSETKFIEKKHNATLTYFYRVQAVLADGRTTPFSTSARTQPRVPDKPIVSVISKSEIALSWKRQSDEWGFNLYRGIATVRSVKKGEPKAWADNDPEYAEPQVVQIQDITHIEKLNKDPLKMTVFSDKSIDLEKKGPESGDYKYAVYAYILRVTTPNDNESGPSPYALTIPSEPQNVLLHEDGNTAEIKWDASPEKSLAGYHVYKMRSTWEFIRVTDKPITENKFTYTAGPNESRFWIVAVDALGQEGQPSSPVWYKRKYNGFFKGDWHQ